MPATLLVNPDLQAVKTSLKQQLSAVGVSENSPDLLVVAAGEKINVETSKQIQQFISLKPYQLKIRVVVIEDATSISELVQNSLLKLIEELSVERILLIGASHTHAFLPTLLSRIQVESAKSINDELLSPSQIAKIEAVLSQDTVERFKAVEKIKEKGEWLNLLMQYYHQKLAKSAQIGPIGQSLLEAERWIGANVNPRAVLEYLMLRLPKNG